MSDLLPHSQHQQTVGNQLDHSVYELKMIWGLRRNLFRLYAVALILSIPAAVIIAIATRNVIPSIVPIPLLFSMKSMVKWAYPPRTS